MNDDRFEQDLHSLLSRAAPAEVPAGFREQMIGTPLRRPRVTWLARRRLFASGLVAASVIAAVVLVGVGTIHFGPRCHAADTLWRQGRRPPRPRRRRP